jgi:outer membrane biosynthesis protein TonB
MSQSQIPTRNRISLATHAAERRSPAAWIGAISLHVAIVVATLFTFSHKLDITDESAPVVPVDLVTIAPKTNIIATAPSKPKVQPDVTPVPAPPPPVAQPVTPPPQEDTEPPPVDTPSSEPLIKAPPPPPLPKFKPQQQPQPDKQKATANSIASMVDTVFLHTSPPQTAKPSTRTTKGFGPQTAMTADIQDALRSQIKPCWHTEALAGMPHPERLAVDFDLFLNPDGTVAQPPQLAADSAAAVASDPYMRAAAETARRAIMECQPYKLPSNEYNTWREISPFHFAPSDMMDQ